MKRWEIIASMAYLAGGFTVLKEQILDNRCKFDNVKTILKDFAKGATIGLAVSSIVAIFDCFTSKKD